MHIFSTNRIGDSSIRNRVRGKNQRRQSMLTLYLISTVVLTHSYLLSELKKKK